MPEFTLSVPVGERVRKAGGFEFVVDSWGRTSNGRVWVEGKSDAGVRRNAWLDSVTIVPPAPEGLEWVGCSQAPEHCLMARQGNRTWHANKEALFLRIGDALLDKWGSAGNQEANQALATEIELVTARHRREKDA